MAQAYTDKKERRRNDIDTVPVTVTAHQPGRGVNERGACPFEGIQVRSRYPTTHRGTKSTRFRGGKGSCCYAASSTSRENLDWEPRLSGLLLRLFLVHVLRR